MTYDFVVKEYRSSVGANEKAMYVLTVEKMPVDYNVLPLLDNWLEWEGVTDRRRGNAIEKLEALPYGAAEVRVQALNGQILIRQVS